MAKPISLYVPLVWAFKGIALGLAHIFPGQYHGSMVCSWLGCPTRSKIQYALTCHIERHEASNYGFRVYSLG